MLHHTDIRGYILKYIVTWVILLNIVHTQNLWFLAIFHNLAGNEHGFLAKTSKTQINTPK